MWVALGRALGIGANVVVSFVLARMLRPADFGAFGLLISIVATSSVAAMCGLNLGVVRFLAESIAANDSSRVRQVLRLSVKIAGVTSVAVSLILLASLFLGLPGFEDLQRPALVFSLAAGSVACLAGNNMLAAMLRGFEEQRLASFLGGLQNGGPLGAGLFLLLLVTIGWHLSRSLETSLALYLVAYAVCLPIGLLWLRNTVRQSSNLAPEQTPESGLPEFTPRVALSVGVPLMLTQVLNLATRESDLWIAGSFSEHGDLALYVAARRIVQTVAVPLGLVNLSVIAMIPGLWSQGRTRELQAVLQTSANVAGAISAACLLVIFIAPGLTLELLFGDYYRQATVPLLILCLGQFVFTVTGACGMVLMMTGYERCALWINSIATCVIVAGGPYVTRTWGINGLAALSSTVIALQNIAQWLLVHHLLGIWTHAWPSWGHLKTAKLLPGEFPGEPPVK